MSIAQCPVCTIARVDGEFRFAHNATVVTPWDLAGLVCQHASRAGCINPCKDAKHGMTWEKRAKAMDEYQTVIDGKLE